MAINDCEEMSKVEEADNGRARCDSTVSDLSLATRSRSNSSGSNSTSSSWSTFPVADDAIEPAAVRPPPDGGWGWMVVVGAIITGALVPGLFMCFGIFMNAFLVVFPNTSKASAAWIPSILNALMNLMGPFTGFLVNTYSCRSVALAGGIILSSGMIFSFFTNSIGALYFTYGVLGGIGSGLSLIPGLLLISQYFQKRRGVATGVCMAVSSAGQVAFPYLLQYTLDEYSYRGCILILGGMTMNICVSAALYRPLEDNYRSESKKTKKLDVKSTKRKRTQSQSSRRSSQSFLAEANGFADLSTTVLQSKLNNLKLIEKKKKSRRGGKSKKSSSGQKKTGDASSSPLLRAERPISNGPQSLLTAESCLTVPRTRSRTMSLESSWVLPGIPEEEHEGDEETHTTDEQEMLVDQTEVNNEVPVAVVRTSSVTEKGEANFLNNNISTNDKLACSRPLLPQDVTVVVTVAGDDEFENNSKYVHTFQQLPRRQSDPESAQIISCMHHPFGSVTSIASIKPAVNVREPLLQRISKSLGFHYFRCGIFYILTFSFTFLIVVLASYTMYMPTYGFKIGLSKEDSAGLVSFISIASMCGRFLVPSFPDYVNVKRRNVYAFCLVILACATFMTAFATNYSVLIASLVIFGFTSGGGVAISLNLFLEYIPLKDFASFFGISQLVVGFVVLFSSPLFGLLLDTDGGYKSAYFIMSFLSAVSACVLYLDRFVKKINNEAEDYVSVETITKENITLNESESKGNTSEQNATNNVNDDHETDFSIADEPFSPYEEEEDFDDEFLDEENFIKDDKSKRDGKIAHDEM